MKKTEMPFLKDPDNLEFNDLVIRLAKVGTPQSGVAEILEVSASQVSRVKNGERHASVVHLRKLRAHLKQIAASRDLGSTPPPRFQSDTPFGMNKETLDRLSPSDAVRAFRELLWARAGLKQFPCSRISVSEEVFVADGGVDASILEGSPCYAGDELLDEGTRFQIKTGDFAPWQPNLVKSELYGRKRKEDFANLGLAVQDALKNGKRIVIVCFGSDPTDLQLRKATKNFKDEFKSCGFPDAKVEVWCQSQLIGLFQEYPSLCLRLRGHRHDGFRSHLDWSSDPDMQQPIRYSAEQQQIVLELQELLATGVTPHIRLIGEPGVGKTRLALEVTRDKRFMPSTLYVKDGRFLLRNLFLNELVQSDDRRFILFVIDECNQKDLAEIWSLLKQKSDRIRIISIDHGPDNSYDDKIRIVNVPTIDSNQIVSILSDHGVTPNDALRWAEYCEGSPRVAHVLGRNLIANPSDLLTPPSITEVWRRFIDGYDSADSESAQLKRVVLSYISIFERFGFELPVTEEGIFIQRLAQKCDSRITEPRFREIVARLKGGRILQGETTLYLTPRMLHIHLYREFWENYGTSFDLIAQLQLIPGALLRWFIGMLRFTHDIKSAENAIDRLLGQAGIFPSGQFKDSEVNAKLLAELAESCPKQTLRCLERTIGRLGKSYLSEVKASRQWLVWTLEKLAVWEDCFDSSARLLLNLAEAANSTNSNNATGTFIGLFNLEFAPTQAKPSTRLSVLASALEDDSQEKRCLGLKGCAVALGVRPCFRMIGPEHQGVRPTIDFWTPSTDKELDEAQREVWELLLAKLAIWKGEDRKQLIETVIKSAWRIIHVSILADSVIDTLATVSKDAQTDIKNLLEFIQRQLGNKESQLSANNLESLRKLLEQLNGRDFEGKLRRFVKYACHDDGFPDELGISMLQRKLDELAIESCNSPELILEQLHWLVIEDASPAYGLAYRISQKDINRSFLNSIVEYQLGGEKAPLSFLSGYLAGIFNRDKHEWEDVMRSLAKNEQLLSRFSDLVISSGISDTMASMVIQLCKNGKQKIDRLERWWFDSQLQSLKAQTIDELVQLQLEEGESYWANSLQMFHTYYVSERAQSKSLPEDLAFTVLTSNALGERDQGSRAVAYYWSRVANAFMAKFPARKWELFESVLRLSSKNWSLLEDLDTNEERLITTLVIQDPITAWVCISRFYSEQDAAALFGTQQWLASGGHTLIGSESPGPIQHIPAQTLFEWVQQDIDERGSWLTRSLPKTFERTVAGRLTRDFIARFGKSERIRNGLLSSFRSRGWMGKDSDHYRVLREEARGWLVDERNANVLRWIQDYIESLDSSIDRSEITEERCLS